MKKLVVIVRGLPGSGKSRLAKALASKVGFGIHAVVCSADDYFNTPRGYEFNPAKLPEAHASCLKNFICSLNLGCSLIVVDNTNIHRWEYLNYEGIALMAGREVKIVEFVAKTVEEVRVCIRRNSHGVPPAVIANMAVEFESDDRAVFKYPIEGDADFSGLLAP